MAFIAYFNKIRIIRQFTTNFLPLLRSNICFFNYKAVFPSLPSGNLRPSISTSFAQVMSTVCLSVSLRLSTTFQVHTGDYFLAG